LNFSPRQLRESFRAWRDSKTNDIIQLSNIWMIYPMLEGRCRGKYVDHTGRVKYVYGPCKNLAYDEVKKDGAEVVVRVARCSIHEDRPDLCRGYPYYNHEQKIEMSADPPKDSPGYMKGCGYNADKAKGHDVDDFAPGKLLPLEEAEK
jgi:Fe-S-cluster containining protein